jgi:hypothetical protein
MIKKTLNNKIMNEQTEIQKIVNKKTVDENVNKNNSEYENSE